MKFDLKQYQSIAKEIVAHIAQGAQLNVYDDTTLLRAIDYILEYEDEFSMHRSELNTGLGDFMRKKSLFSSNRSGSVSGLYNL